MRSHRGNQSPCKCRRSCPSEARALALTLSPSLANATFTGSWNEDQRNGQGIYTYPNKDTYSGGWAADAKDGYGVYTYAATGAHYEGQWSSGKRHGEGNFTFDQYTYNGGFTDDQALGTGEFKFDHGATQKGNFVVDGADEAADDEENKKISTIWKNEV